MRLRPITSSLALKTTGEELGYVYDKVDVNKLALQVLTKQRTAAPYQQRLNALNAKYGFTDMKDSEQVIRILPKMSAAERSQWRSYKANVSRAKRGLPGLERKLKWMKLSRELDWPKPNVNDVMNYAQKKDIVPSEAAAKYMNDNIERFYPHYVVAKANANIIRYRENVDTIDEQSLYDFDKSGKMKWLDEVIEQEDKDWGNGETPMLDTVIKTKVNFGLLVEDIKQHEKQYIIDTVSDHVGMGTTLWTPAAIKVITEKKEVIGMYDQFIGTDQDPDNQKLNEVAIQVNNELKGMDFGYNENDGTMDGLFSFIKSIVRKVLSPFERLLVSPFMSIFNKMVSPALASVLPARLHAAIANLTVASSQILVGKISKQNLRKAVKAGVVIAGYAMKPAAAIVKAVVDVILFIPGMKLVDKYSGGVFTSVKNLTYVPNDMAKGNKIDIKARAMDVVKLGLVVVTFGTASAIYVGTNAAGDATGLDQTVVGSTLLTTAALMATGQAGGGFGSAFKSAAQKTAEQEAKKKVIEKAVSMGIVEPYMAATLVNTIQSGAMGISDNKSMEEIAAKVFEENKKQAAQAALMQTGLANSTIGTMGVTGLTEGVFNENKAFEEAFGESIIDQAETEAVRKVNRKLAPLGVQIENLDKLDQKHIEAIADEIKNFDEKDLQELIARGEQKLEARMTEERLKAEARIEDEKRKIAAEIENFENFDAQEELEELERKANKRILEEQARLSKNLEQMQADFYKGLDRVGKEIKNFDPSKFITGSKGRLWEKLLAEKDRFYANWQETLWKLTNKYGADFLKYLMWKYGPKADYDQDIVKSDRAQFLRWKGNPTDRLYPGYEWGRGLKMIGYGGLGLLAAWIIVGGNE